jgi:hypothetical protein
MPTISMFYGLIIQMLFMDTYVAGVDRYPRRGDYGRLGFGCEG